MSEHDLGINNEKTNFIRWYQGQEIVECHALTTYWADMGDTKTTKNYT